MKNKILLAIGIGVLYTIVASILFSMLFSCSSNYHFKKFIAKGGKIDTTERVIETTKTIRVNGKDSIITLQIPCNCPSVQIPPTRLETRLEYRLKRDSIKTVRYITKWKTKEVVKTKRIEAKPKTNWILLLVGFMIGILTIVMFRRL